MLSSGGARVATDGIERLALMILVAAGRLMVMPGSGVSVESWPALVGLGVTEIHASCSIAQRGRVDPFGFVTGTERRTDRAKVRALKDLLG